MLRASRLLTLPVLLAASLLSACVAPGRPLDDVARQRLDQAFSELERSQRPGLAVVVHQHGRPVYAGYFGLADLEHRVPVSAATRFHAGSIAKPVTAVAILQLAAEGRIDLDAPVRTYLPDFPVFEAPVSVRQLLHHSSGLRDNLDLLAMAGVPRGAPLHDHQLLRILLDQRELNHPPGEEYSYTNSGYTVLAAIVRAVTGESLADWSAAHLFGPLGLETMQLLDVAETPVPDRARSYRWHPQRGWRPRSMDVASAGAGGLVATPAALAQWLDALLRLRHEAPERWQALTTPGALSDGQPTRHDRSHLYAAGLLIGDYRGQRYIGHDGAIAEYRAAAYMLPEHELSVAVMMNGDWRPARDIALFAAEAVLESQGLHLAPWPRTRPYRGEVDIERIEALRGLYVVPQLRPGARLPSVAGIGLLPHVGGLGVNVLGRPLEVAEPLGPQHFRTRRWSRLELDLSAETGVRIDSGAGWEPLPAAQCAEDAFLERLQGIYASAELQSHYRLAYEEGRLLARHPHLPPLWLVCLDPHTFFAVGLEAGGSRGFSEVELVLDGEGEVAALRLSHGPRTRQVLFRRLAPPIVHMHDVAAPDPSID